MRICFNSWKIIWLINKRILSTISETQIEGQLKKNVTFRESQYGLNKVQFCLLTLIMLCTMQHAKLRNKEDID